MSIYKKIRPQQEIRLKKWPAGRVSQLKLFVSHLETAVNNALAAQVQQSPQREFSEFVPVIPFQDITGFVEFREIRLEFRPPRGLRKLLFYEFDLSSSSNFANFERFRSPESFFTFPNLQDAAIYFFRIRVVTTNRLAGPFSDTFSATTPAARAQVISSDTEVEYNIASKGLTAARNADDIDYSDATQFLDLYFFPFDSIGGQAYFSVEYEVEIVQGTHSENLAWADVVFRFSKIDQDFLLFSKQDINPTFGETDFQIGQDMAVTVYGTKDSGGTGDMNASTPSTGSTLTVPGPFATSRKGTLVSNLETFDTGENVIKLQVRTFSNAIHPTTEDFTFSGGTARSFADDSNGPEVKIKLKNFRIFEVNPSASS